MKCIRFTYSSASHAPHHYHMSDAKTFSATNTAHYLLRHFQHFNQISYCGKAKTTMCVCVCVCVCVYKGKVIVNSILCKRVVLL